MSTDKESPAQNPLFVESEKSAKIENTSAILPRWFIRFCQPSRMLWFGPLIGILLSLPSLFSGYMLDDHHFRQNAAPHSVYQQRQHWDYFNFISSADDFRTYQEKSIIVSWWSNPDFTMHFFRPIASLLHHAQFKLLGDNTMLMHAGLILLYGLLILAVALLFNRFSSIPGAAGVAILIFAITEVNPFSSGWITSYNTLLCCVLGMFAFLLHDRWRSTGSVAALAAFIVTSVVSLLTSEGTLALGAYLFAYALFLDRGSLRQRIMSLIPFGTLAVCYIALYVKMRLGVANSGIYSSFSDVFTGAAPRMCMHWIWLIFSQTVSFPPLNMVLTVLGDTGRVIVVVIVAALALILRKNIFDTPQKRFYITAMLLSIVPFTMGPMQERLLLWSGMGAAGFFAELFLSLRRPAADMAQIVTARVLATTNIVSSFVMFIPVLFVVMLVEKPCRAVAAVIEPKNTILLNAPWDIVLWNTPAMADETGREYPDHVYMLYAGVDTVTINRTGEKNLELAVPAGWFREPETSQLTWTPRHPFKAGDTISLKLMRATVLNVNRGGQPTRVRFDFAEPLESFSWMVWSNKKPQLSGVPEYGKPIKQCERLP